MWVSIERILLGWCNQGVRKMLRLNCGTEWSNYVPLEIAPNIISLFLLSNTTAIFFIDLFSMQLWLIKSSVQKLIIVFDSERLIILSAIKRKVISIVCIYVTRRLHVVELTARPYFLSFSIGPRWLMPRMYCSHIGLLYYP